MPKKDNLNLNLNLTKFLAGSSQNQLSDLFLRHIKWRHRLSQSSNTKSNQQHINRVKIVKMAKSLAIAALIATTALCFSSLLVPTNAADGYLFVEGKVYCDTCRVEFQTKLSESIAGAKVRLECKSRENDTLTYSEDGVTDKSGSYSLPVEGDHEEDICQVKLLSSPRSDCNEQFSSTDVARILITKNVGVAEPKRYANALGFKSKTALPECDKVLKDMGFLPLEGQ